MSRPFGVLALAVLAACARYEPIGFDTVGPGYTVGGGEWNTGGGITAVARVFEREGRTMVCGAWATDRQSVLSVPLNSDVMATGSVYAGSARLVQNLSFMAEADRPGDLPGARAHCVVSSVDWQPEFAAAEPRIRFPRLAFLEDDEMGSQIVFRETPRPNVLR